MDIPDRFLSKKSGQAARLCRSDCDCLKGDVQRKGLGPSSSTPACHRFEVQGRGAVATMVLPVAATAARTCSARRCSMEFHNQPDTKQDTTGGQPRRSTSSQPQELRVCLRRSDKNFTGLIRKAIEYESGWTKGVRERDCLARLNYY